MKVNSMNPESAVEAPVLVVKYDTLGALASNLAVANNNQTTPTLASTLVMRSSLVCDGKFRSGCRRVLLQLVIE
jgi:hypothetical protein